MTTIQLTKNNENEIVLSSELSDLITASVSENTRKALHSDLLIFYQWATAAGLTAIPATPLMVAEFIAEMAKNRAVATVSRYVSSISKIHNLNNFENPTKDELVKTALRGLRNKKGLAQKKARALSGIDLIRILERLSKHEWNSRRNSAILCLGWLAALRSSELCALDISDIDSNDAGVIVTVRRSKTDQVGHGTKIGIPPSPLSEPILSWHQGIAKLFGDHDGPLFPRLGYSQSERWFPKIGDRKRLSVRGLSKIIQTILEKNGLSGSVHSLRRGLITEAAAVGVPEAIIQRHSRHRSITVLREYVEEGNIFTDNPLPSIFDRLFGGSQD